MIAGNSSPAGRLRVAVAMSGGVDSSVAAALLLRQGHDVMGLTACMAGAPAAASPEEHARQARRVAAALGIDHVVLDVRRDFDKLIGRPFAEEYARGRTPSPCVNCNPLIKFGLLLRRAHVLGCSHLATGHYARAERRADGWHLLRAGDRDKDQSYFLHRLNQAQLAQALFPLADLTKDEVRRKAAGLGLPVDPGCASRDLCFVAERDYARLVEDRFPGLRQPGEIRDGGGRVLGRHNGFHHFTVGQRHGIGVAAAEALYVRDILAAQNAVIVGPREELMSSACTAEDVRWILGRPPASSFACGVRVRYRHEAQPATVSVLEDGVVQVQFAVAQFAIAPGQAAVFYDGDEVLGGGWIGRNG